MSPHMPVVPPFEDPPGSITPEEFGAIGDGVTDDTGALQAALDAGAGSVLHLHPGKTYLSDEITVSLDDITIMGHGATIKKRSATGSVLLRVLGDRFTIEGGTLSAGGRSCYLIRVNVDGAAPTAVERFTAHRVTFDCDARTAKGIFVGYYDSPTIAKCWFENALADDDPVLDASTFAITLHAGDLQFSQNAIVCNNTIVGFYDGIESFGTGIRQHTLIEGNTVKNCMNVGIYNYRGAQARVISNFVDACVGGIFADSSNAADLSTNVFGNTVQGNVVRHCTTYGILTEEHQGASILGNTCTENQDGIVLGGGTSDVTVAGNNCSYNTRYGIWVDKSLNPVQAHQYDMTFNANVCKLNGEDGLRIGGVKRSCIISGNQLVDNGTTAASAGTSTHAGLHIGLATDAATTSCVLVTSNAFGNDINSAPSTGNVGKQGYGIFIESGGTTTMVIARQNFFDNNGQFNVSSGGAPIDLAGNHYRTGTNSLGASALTPFTFEGQVLIPDGTISLPGLAFAADTDTGFRRSAANTTQLVTTGVEAALINAGGFQTTLPLIINDRLRITPESIKTTNYGAGNTDTCVVMDGTTLTLTLPASPATNQVMLVRNNNATNLTVARNGQNINNAAADLTVLAGTSVTLVHFTGSGWYVF